MRDWEKGRHAPSLRVSWKEGIAAALMMAAADYYVTPLALFLGAGPGQIGILFAAPHLATAVALTAGVSVVRRTGGRLRFLVAGAAAQAALLGGAALLPLLPGRGSVAVLIALVVAFRAITGLLGIAWGSLVSGYLEPHERGRYLGWRARLAGLSGVAGLVLGGLLLQWGSARSLGGAFAALFALAGAARAVSAWLMARMEETREAGSPQDEFTFWQFVRRFRESNFVRFAAYTASLTFATHLAAPFFSVYMLEGLGLPYASYMAVHLAASVGSLAAFPIWGRHADHVGNVRVVKLAGLLVPWIPILWLVSGSPLYLIPLEVAAGFIWGGYNLCSVNFVYDAVSPGKRVRCLAYFNLINGLALFAGSALGGVLAESLPPLRGQRLLALFVLSGVLRGAAYAAFAPGFREVRSAVARTSGVELFFSVVGIRPLIGRATEPGGAELR